jgi:hypothetical protein
MQQASGGVPERACRWIIDDLLKACCAALSSAVSFLSDTSRNNVLPVSIVLHYSTDPAIPEATRLSNFAS